MSNATVVDHHPNTDGLFVLASAPAGWYDVGAGMRRWFDGRRWTDHYTPVLTLVRDPVRTRRSTTQGFHLIMMVMTLGAWAPVWAGVTVCTIIRWTAPRLVRRRYPRRNRDTP